MCSSILIAQSVTKNLKGGIIMTTRYYYAEVENIIYAFTGKKIRDYYVLLHYNLNSHPIYKKDVLKKLGKNLTFSWFGFYATVVKTLD